MCDLVAALKEPAARLVEERGGGAGGGTASPNVSPSIDDASAAAMLSIFCSCSSGSDAALVRNAREKLEAEADRRHERIKLGSDFQALKLGSAFQAEISWQRYVQGVMVEFGRLS